ncbi:hypothetical protein GWK47_049552 [Chionoecetes opilio]|uniref:DDE-1 domain-containing protein n=1 Tax=Chionoecetes opilio TaxID=41210 RepID=A0A8J5CT81_CHIOP|nr:hypothetical protein GWK47_049552 [Chionoecetes opilio]
MDHECFVQTLEHLHKVSYSSMENKILLIMDNAECHMSIHAAEYAIQHGIVIVTLPPHTTAKLQPLDVSVFGPFKSVLRSIQDDFKLSNTHVPITEHMLPEMACKAWDKVCNVTNITNGFRATGIFPVNRNIFPDDAFAGAEVTEQAPPDDDDDLPQTLAAPLTPSSLEPDQPQPGPSGIDSNSNSFISSNSRRHSRSCAALPEGSSTPCCQGAQEDPRCILTEDEEALDQLREKEKKKAAREEKKRRSEEKKREKKREQEARQAAKRRRRSEPVEASSSDEEAADNPALCDDSSEYSDEFAEELEHDAATYPFVQKEPEVGDFVLVQLVFKGKRSEELVHFVAKVISLEEDGRLQLDFLRIKSPLLKDTFHFPAIGDVDSVDRSRVSFVPRSHGSHASQLPAENILTTDRTNLEKAFNHRIETGCSIRTACNLFGVKVSTLGDAFTRSLKESDGRTFVPKHQNIKKVFTDAQEHFIEEYSIKISRMFYGLSTRAFRRMVLKYAEAVGSPAISDVWRRVGMATRDWYYGYMFRHPRLALKAPEGMSLARAMAFNRVNVEVFFQGLRGSCRATQFHASQDFQLG